MQPNPLFVNELRATFKAGATPSALIRLIAERHSGEPQLDRLVRAYFREAFSVPMLQIGQEQVAMIAQGATLPALNSRVIHQMAANRREWDRPTPGDGAARGCWLDGVTATGEAELLKNTEGETLPELAGCWDQLDEQGRRFITRTIASARSLSERVQVLAVLAERLQQQLTANHAEAQQ